MYFSMSNWMSFLPGNAKINRISLPGTHDSCARTGIGAVCQKWDLTTQLANGVRFLDIRCRHSGTYLLIFHGVMYQDMNFTDVIRQCKQFLASNPSEYILMSVRDEGGGDKPQGTFQDTFLNYVNDNGSDLWYLGTSAPDLAAVRGKIALVRRFPGNIGLDFDNKSQFDIQDDYDPDSVDSKWNKITALLDTAKASPNSDKFFLNFASGYFSNISTMWIPDITGLSNRINPRLDAYYAKIKTSGESNWACIIAMDFVNTATKAVHCIINQALLRFNAMPGELYTIFNLSKNAYMYAADYKPYDSDRRRVFTWAPGTQVTQGVWRLIPAGDNGLYTIYNWEQKEYLFSSNIKFDKERREIFTWIPGTVEAPQSLWRLGGNLSDTTIYSTEYKEYLYGANYGKFDNDRHRVFDWIAGTPVAEGNWRLTRA